MSTDKVAGAPQDQSSGPAPEAPQDDRAVAEVTSESSVAAHDQPTQEASPENAAPAAPAPAETAAPAAEQSPEPPAGEAEATSPAEPVERAPGSPPSAETAPASAGASGEAPATPVEGSGGETAGEAEATAAAESAEQPAAEEKPARPRFKLEPRVDPESVRPIPNLTPGVTPPASAPAQEQPTAAAAAASSSPAPAAPPEAQSGAEAETPAAESSPEPPPVRREAVEIPAAEELDADLESQIAAAMAPDQVQAPQTVTESEEGETPVTVSDETLTSGTKLKGRVQQVDAENVFVDLNLRMTGVVPLRQFEAKQVPEAGQELSVVVETVDETEGVIVCNIPRGRSKISGDWNSVSPGQVVDCQVTKTNKGGLEVTVGNLRGFIPASQVDLGFVSNLEQFVGQKFAARVTEVKPARRRLVLSRRSLLAEERAALEAQAMDELKPGLTLTGTVKTIKDYGAFIDLGGVDGFLHIGQISWRRIKHPSEELTEGQSVNVKVLNVDKEKKRISLGLRQLEQNPWTLAESKYAKGSEITGKVTRTEGFGAFVELEPGVEGLIHISELDHKRVGRVEDVVKVGESVNAKVLEVDPKKKRVSLSLKALKNKPTPPRDEDLAPGKGETYQRQRKGDLRGGIGGDTPGGLFGDPRKFS